MTNDEFQELVWEKGRELYRDMPWRENTDPYFVLVSELMLQQTQVDRVIPKFDAFISRFPTVADLARASLGEVLALWSGLGYNRRAKYLYEAAKKVMNEYSGVVPSTVETLVGLPGVGPNTAGAIMAYSYNQPVVFIETNIRTVYFYHFFEGEIAITDATLRTLAEETIDREHPREWYWSLMDYGSFLKKQGAGSIDKSKHYKKQSPLKGSLREVRGLILKQLANEAVSETVLRLSMPNDERFERALAALKQEGLIQQTADRLHLAR